MSTFMDTHTTPDVKLLNVEEEAAELLGAQIVGYCPRCRKNWLDGLHWGCFAWYEVFMAGYPTKPKARAEA